MSVLGIGVDVADIARVGAALQRTPLLARKLFTPGELTTRTGHRRTAASLAARFAAKEAVAKVLEHADPGWRLTDIEVSTAPSGRPRLTVGGPLALRARCLGITTWHLSLSHDRGTAIAVVVAEG